MTVDRVPLIRPFTPTEEVVVELIGRGLVPSLVGLKLGLKRNAVNFHLARAGGKIPGDLPRVVRIIVWYRGGSREVLGDYHSGSDRRNGSR